MAGSRTPPSKPPQAPLVRFGSPTARFWPRCAVARRRPCDDPASTFVRPCGFPPRLPWCTFARFRRNSCRTGAQQLHAGRRHVRPSFAAGFFTAGVPDLSGADGAASPARSRAGNAPGVHTLRSIVPVRGSSRRYRRERPTCRLLDIRLDVFVEGAVAEFRYSCVWRPVAGHPPRLLGFSPQTVRTPR